MRLKLQISLSVILIAVLAFALILVGVYEGTGGASCSVPADCSGLVHPECVGSWLCVSSQCAWLCATNETGAGTTGGLSGSTVECISDGDCAAGVCPDGYRYQKASCQNYVCRDLQFFADPCLGHY